MKIAWLGTGMMGSGFVRNLRKHGHDVRVWNRSADKARALEADGARAFATPAEAVQGAERIHLILSDDASVDGVLEPIAEQIKAATWIVDHTTTAPTPTAERTARWNARGRTYVHAPVFMGPSNALEGTGLMLVCGEKSRHDKLLPDLEPMTGKVIYVGAEPHRAATFKLIGNLSLIAITGILADVNRLAKASDVSTDDAMAFFQHFNPGVSIPARATKIAAGQFSPANFEMTMARKDVRLILEETKRARIDLFVMPGVAALLDAGIARGDGSLDSSAAARL
jgi:3-hydroxyisobutyrate dehydrogenase